MNIRGILTLAALLCFAGFAATTAHAGGIYVGGGVGDASIADTSATPSGNQFDESASAWKAFAGYRFDLLPIVSLSAEVGYRDLGAPDAGALEYSVSGFDYAALAGLGLGPIEVFARLGGMQFDLDKTSSGVTTEFDGTAPLYGIGASFSLGSLGVRAEYELIDIDELDDVEMISISAFYSF